MDYATREAIIWISILGGLLHLLIFVVAALRGNILLEKRDAVPLQYFVVSCVLFLGYSLIWPFVFVYYACFASLFILAIPLGLIFKACIEPLCGPFACLQGTTFRGFMEIANRPPVATIKAWESFSVWMVGAGSLKADGGSSEGPSYQLNTWRS